MNVISSLEPFYYPIFYIIFLFFLMYALMGYMLEHGHAINAYVTLSMIT